MPADLPTLQRSPMPRQRLSSTNAMEWRQWIALLRLEAGELDHLSPLLGFLCDKLAEVGGRAGKYFTTQFGHSYLHRRIGEHRVDLPVEPLDNLCRGALRNADAEPAGHRIARDNVADQRDVRQHPQMRRRGHSKRAQPTRLDMRQR